MIRWATHTEITEPKARAFYNMVSDRPTETLIANVQTEVKIVSIADKWFLPVTINNTEWENSYVCSPYTAFITYSREELDRNVKNLLLRKLIHALLYFCAGWFKRKQLNKVIHVNNFLFSTNPYPDWMGTHLPHLTDFLTAQYPDHAIVFRSLNEGQHTMLMKEFEQAGYLLSASRQVYLFHRRAQTFSRHRNVKLDRRKVRQNGLQWIGPEAMGGYLEQARLLYNKLYLEKYSPLNPQYNLLFFQEAYQSGMIRFYGYIDKQQTLKAFSGIFESETTITSPLVGYDTSAPQKEELYIHASQLVFKQMLETDQVLNLSSGAASFKRLRGGQPHIEYSAIYCKHLPKDRQRLFRILKFITNKIGVPILKKYKL
ncbi:MAG TPA: hypothetical protein VNB90_06595 [Cytophagaceae bacterium]|nr:hypothetical protein [Cytophagaceae bacterium]